MCSLHLKCEYVAIMLGSPYLSSFLGSAVDGGIEDYDIRYENITAALRYACFLCHEVELEEMLKIVECINATYG